MQAFQIKFPTYARRYFVKVPEGQLHSEKMTTCSLCLNDFLTADCYLSRFSTPGGRLPYACQGCVDETLQMLKAFRSRVYQSRLKQATPKWVDRKELAKFYQLAKALEYETGIPHHVDHMIPLNHPRVCGLNVPANLHVISWTDNLKKSNKFNEEGAKKTPVMSWVPVARKKEPAKPRLVKRVKP